MDIINLIYIILAILFVWCFTESFKESKYTKLYRIVAGIILGLAYIDIETLLSYR